SVHRFGQQVRQRIELARQSVAELIGARPRDLVFTSGGTEADNLAIRGVLEPALDEGGTTTVEHARASPPPALITTPVEHSAVREPAEWVAGRGGAVVALGVDDQGLIDLAELAAALAEHACAGRVVLVSV